MRASDTRKSLTRTPLFGLDIDIPRLNIYIRSFIRNRLR